MNAGKLILFLFFILFIFLVGFCESLSSPKIIIINSGVVFRIGEWMMMHLMRHVDFYSITLICVLSGPRKSTEALYVNLQSHKICRVNQPCETLCRPACLLLFIFIAAAAALGQNQNIEPGPGCLQKIIREC